MKKNPNWNRRELLIALNLYSKIPFGKIHHRNPEIINLANLIGRTPSAVTWKLSNFASFDPELQKRDIKGARHASKLDQEIWWEFFGNLKDLAFQSEQLMANIQGKSVEEIAQIEISDLPKEGKERESVIKTRVNQSFFRKIILSSYNKTCCITGLRIPSLLVAGHIKPWSEDETNRLNPHNGLCLNYLHDKAFENGLITITPAYKIKSASKLKDSKDKVIKQYFVSFNNQSIQLPTRFLPDKSFLEFHNEMRFIG